MTLFLWKTLIAVSFLSFYLARSKDAIVSVTPPTDVSFVEAYLARSKDDIVLVEDADSCCLGGHVGTLQHILDSCLDQGLGIGLVNLVLGGTGHGNVILGTLNLPWLLALNELACTCKAKVRCLLSLQRILASDVFAA